MSSYNYNNNNKNVNNGIGFFGLLQIVFIVLKLCRVINWSWMWVLSPFWISFILFVLLIVAACLISSK